MDYGNVIEEVASILERYKNKQIRPEFAKTELLYMIKASRTMAELNAAGAAYEQIQLIKKRVRAPDEY